MKKIFISLACCLFAANLSIQANDDLVIATFENTGYDDSVTNTTPWYDSNFYDVQPTIMTNPLTNGINTTSQCYGMVKKNNAEWWGAWTFFTLKTPITITAEQPYLKMMINRSGDTGGTTFGWNTNDKFFTSLEPQTDGVWEDLVWDLSDKIGETLSVLVLVHHNWDGQNMPQATILFDEIVLSGNALPRGVTLIDGSGFNLGFEKSGELEKWVSNIELNDVSDSYDIVNNPFIDDELNQTSKAMQFNKGDVTWWHGGPHFELSGLMEVGESVGLQYLHATVAVPSTAFDASGVCTIQTSAWDHLNKETQKNHMLFEGQENMWNELVFDISEELNYVNKIAIRFDIRVDADDEWVNSPAGIFYVDAITINNIEEERSIITNIKTIDTQNDLFNVICNGTSSARVVSNIDGDFEIGSITGAKVRKFSANKGDYIYVNTLPSGTYYIKASSGKTIKTDLLIIR